MRKKRQRFQDNAQCAYIIEPGKISYLALKGAWQTKHFCNQHPIVLEVGCGEGEYTVGLAQHFPNKNFIGVDIKGARLWKGSSWAITHQIDNIAFLRTDIVQLDQFFALHEVAELYIPFPDPRPRGRDAKRRLTSPHFLALYQKIVRPGGTIHLKTDNDALFTYTLSILREWKNVHNLSYTENLYQSSWLTVHYGIQTKYERAYLQKGTKIKYLQFCFGRS